jgi:hypothetical protein
VDHAFGKLTPWRHITEATGGLMQSLTFLRAFRIDPYGWHLYLFNDRAKWSKFVTRKMGGGGFFKHAMGALGLTQRDVANKNFYVGIFDCDMGTLAHEMTHVATYVLHHAGVEISAENDEPLAYLIGHLVDECKIAVED